MSARGQDLHLVFPKGPRAPVQPAGTWPECLPRSDGPSSKISPSLEAAPRNSCPRVCISDLTLLPGPAGSLLAPAVNQDCPAGGVPALARSPLLSVQNISAPALPVLLPLPGLPRPQRQGLPSLISQPPDGLTLSPSTPPLRSRPPPHNASGQDAAQPQVSSLSPCLPWPPPFPLRAARHSRCPRED